ncbi:MAG: SAF domain-containing protein, partial [Acidimicrobiia bacterium]
PRRRGTMVARPSDEANAAPEPIRLRGILSRVSAGHVLIVLAGLLAVLLNLAVLRSQDDARLVAVAAVDIPVGSTVAAGQLRLAEVDAAPDVLARLVSDLGSLEGQIAVRPIAAGALVARDDLRPAAAPLGLRAMSVPVPVEHAAGGELRAGDRVDVIQVVDGVPGYVVAGAEVLSVPDRQAGPLASTGGYFVVVAVDADTALALAAALDQGSIEVVRSTGAAPPEVTSGG